VYLIITICHLKIHPLGNLTTPMKIDPPPSRRSLSGFTLIELMVVLAIIGLMTGLGVPAFRSLGRAMDLTQSAQIISDQMTLARQMALSGNRQIEVRLYSYTDPQGPANAGARVQAIQLFQVPESTTLSSNLSGARDSLGYFPVSKLIPLPRTSIIIDSGSTLSSLIGKASGGTTAPILSSGTVLGYSIYGVRQAYTATRFSFMPDGSTNLPAQTTLLQWFVTVHDNLKGDKLATPPSNFATIQIQPSNGKILTYRP
jgi:uncharacterized protein (TIGR02596 family)